ncbi:MAG: glycosyl transferase [Comamonadaceae bacterium]|nr:glycosyl transferase [Comamonadaceae bacterium]
MVEEKLGVVIIGRNEGERLRRCLASVTPFVTAVVYVDSGSTDGSIQAASDAGAEVVELDMSMPFTAARARNQGLARLLHGRDSLEFVQFVDGDCEVVRGWLDAALEFLAGHPGHAVVCGRRRERYPEHSIYNRLCDDEWNTPPGEALTCGGDALMRVAALRAVGGYRESLIAGEEPELCLRLRQAGWRIQRIDVEMTLHDAAMTRFGQWWKRTVRSGHAFAEGAWLHGTTPERHWVRETRRAWLWGAVLPAFILIFAIGLGPFWWLLSLIYPLQWLRLYMRSRSASTSTFLLIGKFAEAWGAMKFHVSRLRGTSGSIIEYK